MKYQDFRFKVKSLLLGWIPAFAGMTFPRQLFHFFPNLLKAIPLLGFGLLMLPAAAGAMEVKEICNAKHPILTVLRSYGISVDRQICAIGTELELDQQPVSQTLLRTGEALEVDLPGYTDIWTISPKLHKGRAAEIQLWLEDPQQNRFELLIDTSLELEQALPGRYRLLLEGDSYAELRVALLPVELVAFRNYNLILPEDNLAVLDSLLAQAGDLLIVGNPALAEQFGAYYVPFVEHEINEEEALDEESEVYEEIDFQISTQALVFDPRVDYQVVYAQDEQVLVAAIWAGEHLQQQKRVILMTDDIFRLDQTRLEQVMTEISTHRLFGIVPASAEVYNPAEATWLNLALTLVKESKLVWLVVFLLVALTLFYRPWVKWRRQGCNWQQIYRPAATRWGRLWQLAGLVGVILTISLGVIGQRILAMEQSTRFVRTLVDRLRGIDDKGGDFCRKCIFILDMPWILIPALIFFVIGWVWVFWDVFSDLYQLLHKRWNAYLASNRLEKPLVVVLFVLLTLLVYLPLFNFSWRGYLLLAVLLVSMVGLTNWQQIKFKFDFGCKYCLMVVWVLAVPLYGLGLIEQNFFVFSKCLRTGSSFGWDNQVLPAEQDYQLVLGRNFDGNLYFDNSKEGKAKQATLFFELVNGTAELTSRELFSNQVITIGSGMDRLQHYDFEGRFGLWLDPDLQLAEDAALVAGMQEVLPTRAAVALLVPEDESWRRQQDDYFARNLFYDESPLIYEPGIYDYELNLRGGELIFYTYAQDSLQLEIIKQDLNESADRDLLTVMVADSQGEIVAYGFLDDDGGLLGTPGEEQGLVISVPEADFSDGIYQIILSGGWESTSADYVLRHISLNTPYLVMEGALNVLPQAQLVVSSQSGLTIRPGSQQTRRVCLTWQINAKQENECATASQPVYLASQEQLILITDLTGEISLGRQYDLFAPAAEAFFQPYLYRWQTEINPQTRAVVADSRITCHDCETGKVYAIGLDYAEELSLLNQAQVRFSQINDSRKQLVLSLIHI